MTDPAPRQKTVHVKSYGCQMNVYDGARMVDALAPAGYVEVPEAADADLIILNTCHIREKAVDKVYSEIGRLEKARKALRKEGGDRTLVLAGCVAQAEGSEILRRAPAVDLVVGPQAYHRLPELLARGRGTVDTEFPAEDKFLALPPAREAKTRARGPSAFVTVQEGCDKFCTFCVVPYTRGAEISRPVSAVLDEVRRLADAGVVEVSLLGQNVNAYHGLDETGRAIGLAALIERVAQVPGISRLRYSTSHPRDMDADLINAHRDIPALMPFLHLPVQSGSDSILAAMNRKHSAAQYLESLDRVRSVRPDIAFSSDFIVGFPGETEADFEETMQLVERVGFASAYSFKYSQRPGTPGATMGDQVPEAVKVERLARLQAVLGEQQKAFNRASLDRRMAVLFERRGQKPGQLQGRSPYMQAVQVEGPEALLGKVVDVEITSLGTWSLNGALCPPQQERAA